MVAIWYLLVLAPFIAIPILWWHFRRRAAERESMADARWQKLVSTATADSAAAPASVAAGLAVYTRRSRTLDPAQTVLYYLLKNSLPDHEVMPLVSLAAVLEVSAQTTGSEREQRLGSLARHNADFVVCNKALQPLVVIDLPLQEMPVPVQQDFKTRSLGEAGIRYLRLSRKALPRREALRALVLGE
jgi:hypothetical protein